MLYRVGYRQAFDHKYCILLSILKYYLIRVMVYISNTKYNVLLKGVSSLYILQLFGMI